MEVAECSAKQLLSYSYTSKTINDGHYEHRGSIRKAGMSESARELFTSFGNKKPHFEAQFRASVCGQFALFGIYSTTNLELAHTKITHKDNSAPSHAHT